MPVQYHTARFRLVPHLAKTLNVPAPAVRKPGRWCRADRAAAGTASRQAVPDGVAERRLVQVAAGDDVDDHTLLGLADLILGDGRDAGHHRAEGGRSRPGNGRWHGW